MPNEKGREKKAIELPKFIVCMLISSILGSQREKEWEGGKSWIERNLSERGLPFLQDRSCDSQLCKSL